MALSSRYISTRGGVPPCSFEQALFAGLAEDGGLYLPESWPRFDRDELGALQACSYEDVACRILQPFIGDEIEPADLKRLIDQAYAGFRHAAIAPLRQLDGNDWLLELFHGPTLAFKDVALQLLGLMFEHFLKRRADAITIVGATSGDTGAAALAAVAGRERMRIIILHPEGRVSEVQRRQMTTVAAGNVHNIAIKGHFDDCQALVKAMFGDQGFRKRHHLAAINSINWGRIMAQTVYYVTAAVALGSPWRKVSFAVPTGNFGDVYAGYVAAKMGLPIDQLIVATNQNDILARFLTSGVYASGEVRASLSPSMDIQVASNFERLLFDLLGRDANALRLAMAGFADHKSLSVDEEAFARAREIFEGAAIDEAATLAEMKALHGAVGELIDPHSAVGHKAGLEARGDASVPLISLATAHPAKFPDAVKKATGIEPALPPHMRDLFEKNERFVTLPADLAAVQTYIDKLGNGH